MKVDVAKQSGKKWLHKLAHDFSTTSDFGFCQPCLCREMNAQDTASVRFGQIVRLNPLVVPTFGEVKLKTYSSFVKTADLYHGFESLLTGESYNGAIRSYVPTVTPCISFCDLTTFIYRFSNITIYKATGYTSDTSGANYTGVTVQSGSDFTTAFGHFKTDIGVISQFAKDVSARLGYYIHQRYSSAVDVNWTGFSKSSVDLDPAKCDWTYSFRYSSAGSSPVYYIVCGNLTNYGKNLRKIFLGLGGQLNLTNVEFNILRLFAFYKVYFDLFEPRRDITWKDTSAFSLMEMYEQYGYDTVGFLTEDQDLSFKFCSSFCQFFLDLCNAYYTINPDFASAHIVGLSTESQNLSSFSVKYLNAFGEDNGVSNISESTSLPFIDELNDPYIDFSRSGLRVLNELTKLVNIHTAEGGDIGQYLRSVFDSDYVDEVDSIFLGSQVTDCNISPVFSTNKNDMVDLGAYAGQGVGSSDGKSSSVKFTARSHGFLISFFAVVPDAKMCQGIDPSLLNINRFDYFHPQFDGVTLLPTMKMCIYGCSEDYVRENSDVVHRLAAGFGNMPNYSGLKIAHNVLSGEMSQGSTRASYLPFTLDKILPYRNNAYNSTSGTIRINVGVQPELLVASKFWRYIGRNRWFGNFNRVFVNEGIGDSYYDPTLDILGIENDNFIIQMYIDLNVNSFMLPLSKSFDTGAFDSDTMTVQKA